MRALLQMTMETEDTTERLSAPTVPSWNFSPATPISTPPPQAAARQADSPENAETRRPQEHQTTPPTSTCEAQKGHISIEQRRQKTPGRDKSRPFRPKLHIYFQRREFNQTKLDLGDELVNLS
jgi:hypothetical protein